MSLEGTLLGKYRILSHLGEGGMGSVYRARDEMLTRTHSAKAPWVCVRGDDKEAARLNVLRHLTKTLAPKAIARAVDGPDPDILYVFDTAALSDGRLER